jgi:N-succinyldiaminopimelate aminotransferase
MNPQLDKLQPYPFEKTRSLLADLTPPRDLAPISFAIGEPRDPAPAFALDVLRDNLDKVSQYPSTRGLESLRAVICEWLARRFAVPRTALDPDCHVLPVNGTREALFSFTQAIIDTTDAPVVVMPNPFYQIYEGAALLAGAEPYFINCDAANDFVPDFDAVPAAVWRRCQLLFICTPGNPTGSVLDLETLKKLIMLADEHDFVIASDECYSEIYPDENNPPPGLLQACAALGRDDFHRCMVFHSLSKRSNLPGLRSGFVAGDAHIMARYFSYRTYHGCAMPVQHQLASIAAWDDEIHVRESRQRYRRKFEAVLDILAPVLDVGMPAAGFYLWPRTPVPDTEFTRQLLARQHVRVVPGTYLARGTAAGNPGAHRVRMALVAELEQCIEGAQRIRGFLEAGTTK